MTTSTSSVRRSPAHRRRTRRPHDHLPPASTIGPSDAGPDGASVQAALGASGRGENGSLKALRSLASRDPDLVLGTLRQIHAANHGLRRTRRTSLDATTVRALAGPLLTTRSPNHRSSAAGLLSSLCRDAAALDALRDAAHRTSATLDPMVDDILDAATVD